MVGSDLIGQIPRWRQAAEVLRRCRLAIAPREGWPLDPGALEALERLGGRWERLDLAVPGTVIGVAYVFAFNVPPLEITGTALIIVLCFVFRNMPVGVRAGMASMSQIDRSLDEASSTLRGRAPQTLAYVVLPLLRPAIVGALVYGFVRAVTTVSAVVFLVTAEYELATTYIILRVINGDYGLAIAYSCALIVLMLAVILLIQFVVGERRLGRRVLATGRRSATTSGGRA